MDSSDRSSELDWASFGNLLRGESCVSVSPGESVAPMFAVEYLLTTTMSLRCPEVCFISNIMASTEHCRPITNALDY
ncbi:hypothetical protein TNIN_306911 [Trichonephila inaurata madagascariensis]|uniref:Uncharacterized protein n=1 Tax=Trichonephila inaurata madagascariensis TaxID=2747483 RepID=A0A8X7BVW4_9ARAC|nr:hypothetical protein TNIN_306911 [Trichonephila inaurata madagascariensis]